MTNTVLDERELIRGAARFADLCYLLSKSKELMERDVAHTSIIGLDRGEWAKAATVKWNSTAIAVAKHPAEKLVVVGEDGQVCAYVGGKAVDEALSPKPKLIRGARTIAGEVYACGMKRQAYRRRGEGDWKDISAPAPTPKEKAAGFESIDGYAHDDIYAVGWSGEIWRYDGASWSKQKSPTKKILTAVCCAGDGFVYAAGQGGTIVKGRNDAWKALSLKDVSVDLWDLCWYDGKLYVAANEGLFTLEKAALVPVEFGDAGAPTCFSLTSAAGVLWSIGPSDVLSFDGAKWVRYS